MKEAIVLVPGFGASYQNKCLDEFLTPGLLAQLEDIELRVDPEAVKIPGQMGKRFYCQLDESEKVIDIYEIFWDDLIEHLSAKDIRRKAARGLFVILYWLFDAWKIAKSSLAFFLQSTIILLLVLAWYYGIVIIVLATISEQTDLDQIDFFKDLLRRLESFASEDIGWKIWVVTSSLLALLPIPIGFIVDLIDFFISYCQNESNRGRPPVRALVRHRLKMGVDNVLNDGSYDRVTILAHSMGALVSTDFLADFHHREAIRFRYITWGSSLESAAAVTHWVGAELAKCLSNPHVERWDDFYSRQDWLCSKVPKLRNQAASKLTSREVSFKVSFFKQVSGESHQEYFFDPKVLRSLILG